MRGPRYNALNIWKLVLITFCSELIIIEMYWWHRFSWIFLTICSYQPSLLLGPLDCIQCPHMYVFACQPTLVCSCVGVRKRTSLMSLSLLLQQRLEYFVSLTWMVCEMEGKWLYTCCFVGYCFQDFLKQHSTFLSSFHLVFSPNILLETRWCNHTVVLVNLQLEKIPISLKWKDQISIWVHLEAKSPECAAGFDLCGYLCKKYTIIWLIWIHNGFCLIPSASCQPIFCVRP